MAIYHLSIRIISRGKGKSAVATAAYRAGEKITNEYDGIIHDYTRKSGVVHTEILLPSHAPPEFSDRATFWNSVEQIEKNRNAQLAREIELALPIELTREQNISLFRDYCWQHFVKAGMCADFCIHDKNNGNPHVYIMLTMRSIEQDGNWGLKAHKVDGQKVSTTDWNEQSKEEEWRAAWADMCNATLERQGLSERIDHRSYERQGVVKIPAVHLGVAASQMEHKGIRTERDNINREIKVSNNQLR
jgi:ATP-dependent exoDNAse (exonuclease V) alpha subunit